MDIPRILIYRCTTEGFRLCICVLALLISNGFAIIDMSINCTVHLMKDVYIGSAPYIFRLRAVNQRSFRVNNAVVWLYTVGQLELSA